MSKATDNSFDAWLDEILGKLSRDDRWATLQIENAKSVNSVRNYSDIRDINIEEAKSAILAKCQEREAAISRKVAINAMAIALYWLEEDGRPKHLMQDLWDVENLEVLELIDAKWLEEARGHFATLTNNKEQA